MLIKKLRKKMRKIEKENPKGTTLKARIYHVYDSLLEEIECQEKLMEEMILWFRNECAECDVYEDNKDMCGKCYVNIILLKYRELKEGE